MNLSFVEEAFASETASFLNGSMLNNLMPIALIMIVFYFLLLRPQQKKIREHRDMIKALERNSTVVFGSGMIGTIVKDDDEKTFVVEIAPNVKVRIRRDSVTELLKEESVKSLPASEEKVIVKKIKK